MELSLEQNISLVRRFVSVTFVNAGMCADVCVHIKKEDNPHAHIMLTMRPLNEDGSWGAKIKKAEKKPVYTTDWNDCERTEDWRKGKAKKALEAAEAYDWKHLNALQDYGNAEKYLRDVLQGRFDPKKLPITKWQDELAVKTSEREALHREYDSLRSETQKVEQIRRSVTEIMREESQERKPQKSHGMEL